MHFYRAAHTGIKYIICIGTYTYCTVIHLYNMLASAAKDSYRSLSHTLSHIPSLSFSLSHSLSLSGQSGKKKNVFFLPVCCLVAYCCAVGVCIYIYIYAVALTWHESVLFFSFNYAKNNKTRIETFRQHIISTYII